MKREIASVVLCFLLGLPLAIPSWASNSTDQKGYSSTKGTNVIVPNPAQSTPLSSRKSYDIGAPPKPARLVNPNPSMVGKSKNYIPGIATREPADTRATLSDVQVREPRGRGQIMPGVRGRPFMSRPRPRH